MWVFSLYIWWLHLRAMAYYNRWVSHALCGMWAGITFTAGVLMVGVWDERYGQPEWSEWLTWVSWRGWVG